MILDREGNEKDAELDALKAEMIEAREIKRLKIYIMIRGRVIHTWRRQLPSIGERTEEDIPPSVATAKVEK